MTRRKTAGELSLKASSDKTKYDPLEVGYALCDDVVNQLYICANRHENIFDEDEYCIMLVVASDPLIKGIRRHKYAAFLYLPSPRPEQSCYLYNKKTQKLKRLWTLPSAMVMATISETPIVADKWKKTKAWCDAFYNKTFWEYIRKEHGISILSELEYLNANREELIKAGAKQVDPSFTEPFDFRKISVEKIVDTKTSIVEQGCFNDFRQAQHA